MKKWSRLFARYRAKALAEMLAINTTLMSLGLTKNQIGDKGVRALAKSLIINDSLKELCLGFNQISTEGAKVVARKLNKNTALEKLALSFNQINADGIKLLAKMLALNSTLISLEVWGNQESDKFTNQIQEFIKRNQRYKKDLQQTAYEQLRVGRLLLYKIAAMEGNTDLCLPIEIRERVVKYLDKKKFMTKEQQRLILNYAEGKIAPVADKLTFFRVTKCDRIRKQLKQDGIEAAPVITLL